MASELLQVMVMIVESAESIANAAIVAPFIFLPIFGTIVYLLSK